MTTCWKFSVGLSLILFLATLAVVSVLTPAAQEVAGKINDPTLKAAAATKNAMRQLSCTHSAVEFLSQQGPATRAE